MFRPRALASSRIMTALRETSIVRALRVATELGGRTLITKVGALTALKGSAGLLDIAGIVLLAQFSATVLSAASSTTNSNPLGYSVPGTESWRPLFLLAGALVLMSLRSALSFFAGVWLNSTLQQANTRVISARAKLELCRPLDGLDQFSSQETHHALTGMTRASVSGFLLPLSTVISEGVLGLLLIATLYVASPAATVLSIIFLALVSLGLYRFISHRQLLLGQRTGSATVRSIATFQELHSGHRELRVSGRLEAEINRFTSVEGELSDNLVAQNRNSTIPRHVLETAVLLCLGIVATISSAGSDDIESLVIVTVFAAALARLLPSVIPMQAALSELQHVLGTASSIDYPFVKLRTGLESHSGHSGSPHDQDPRASGSAFAITASSLSYRYPGAKESALESIDFNLSGSGWYAIDGPSGSGKSTLLDLMLGLRLPTEGQVTINDLVAHEFIEANPGFVSYLPQSPMVMNRSLWENVAFGYTIDDVDRNRVTQCLQQVGLESLVRRADTSGETLGERGGRLSGGQLQRLGIARCLYQEPNVLVLDESTSGLDESARDGIISLLHSLVASGLTVVTVAHDRTLAAQATRVIRLANGNLVNS